MGTREIMATAGFHCHTINYSTNKVKNQKDKRR